MESVSGYTLEKQADQTSRKRKKSSSVGQKLLVGNTTPASVVTRHTGAKVVPQDQDLDQDQVGGLLVLFLMALCEAVKLRRMLQLFNEEFTG